MIYKELDLPVNIKWKGLWDIEHKIYRPSWKDIARLVKAKLLGYPVSYKELNIPNALMDEGEQVILEFFFRNNNLMGASPFYFGLGNNGGTPGVPAETATLASITEVSGSGYARIAVARDTTDWGATALDAGDYQTTSATKTFSATGTWTAADYLFLTDVDSGTSGKLLATVALSASRTLVNGDSLQVSMKVKLQ